MPSKRSPRYARTKKKAYKKTSLNLKLKRKYRVSKGSFKKYGVALALFVLSLGFLFSLSLYKYVNQSLASALSPGSYSILEDPYPTIAYIAIDDLGTDPISVQSIKYLVLDTSSKKMVSYDIPLNLVVDVPGRFGEEEFEKIFSLGALSSEDAVDGGMALLGRSLFKTFGYKVDKYVIVTAPYKDAFDTYWSGGDVLSLLDSQLLKSSTDAFRTDLSVQEFFSINKFLNSLPSDRFIARTLDAHYMDSLVLIDEEIRDITYESSLALEKKDIAVLNGTDRPGVAALGARIVKNMGGRVVAIGNSSITYDTSKLVVDDKSTSSVRDLSYVFRVEDIQEKTDLTRFEENAFERADIVLIVGFDFVKDLY